MCAHTIRIVKHEFKLYVMAGDCAVETHPVAIGERPDGKARLYEEDFRTPEGRFQVTGKQELATAIPDYMASLPMGPNSSYYPFYLAHKFGEPFTDLGYCAYGHGVISLSYPRPEDRGMYERCLETGEVERDWHDFMEEKWRSVFAHISETSGTSFEEVRLSHEKRRGERSFVEGKTFGELYHSLPPPPELALAIHGTNDPACIGHKITGGCIRMHNHDIRSLLRNVVEVGMQVAIDN